MEHDDVGSLVPASLHLYIMEGHVDREEVRAIRIQTLSAEGLTQREVAQRLGISCSTVCRTLRRFRETGSNRRRHGQGRPRATSAVDDRFLHLTALRDRFQTSVQLANRLRDVRQVVISGLTVRRRLHEYELQSRRPAIGPLLTREHRLARAHFAQEYQQWTPARWGTVLFTDESRFTLHGPDGRQRVWRRRGERFAAATISPRVPYGGGSVMVWAGISLEARTELHFVNGGRITGVRYVEEILQEYVVPFAHFVGPHFMLLHDNARPHTAQVVHQYLHEVGIRLLAIPARSPDLNPIEHVWDELGRRIRHRDQAPTTLRELENVLSEEWENISQEYIANIISSMPNRLGEVRTARGGVTRY